MGDCFTSNFCLWHLTVRIIYFPFSEVFIYITPKDLCNYYVYSSNMLLLLLSPSIVSNSVQPQRRQPTRLPRPWDSLVKNTGVGCHFLLQCMKVKSESDVAQSCLTLSDPMDCSPPGSSVHGICQGRVLEWGATAFSLKHAREIFSGRDCWTRRQRGILGSLIEGRHLTVRSTCLAINIVSLESCSIHEMKECDTGRLSRRPQVAIKKYCNQ